MSIQVSTQQFEQLEQNGGSIVVVQNPQTKHKYVVLPQDTFNRARALFEYLTLDFEPKTSAKSVADDWSVADNERRVVLINKKHDARLTRTEERELSELQDRAYRYRERVAPVRNDVLRLLAEAVERRCSRKSESR